MGRRRFDGLAHLARTHLAGGSAATGPAKAQIRLIARPADLHPSTPEGPAADTPAEAQTADPGEGSSAETR